MDNNSLAHYGIKGMKWGVRRYQNKDGSLTAAGNKRYYKEADKAGYKEEGYNGRRFKSSKKGKSEGFDADPNQWVKDDLNRSRRLVDETNQLTNKLKNANDTAMRNKPKTKMDLSQMSDKEMRDQINRAILERQYNEMFAPQNVSSGREHVSRVLETTGTVLAIGNSALGIALAIKELKG